ncbi:MAG: tRNA (N(6)-L-threonylcarbamoyladenosine(37)-C(2))-methylthiotransferase [Candidatus Bathyarchaeota archaeon]|nr:tRNA (N(6)-L-threonylcarbamoyladenosine(37)-C(2))-methylthiotransferase [Candidatus Bathyarchaeota archaeon]MDH5733432.1 tRNA (N(6)-L-threonylcarbamoyladenosine(37)-C(2))-methylthiotransferase [Candidatus Bathyarchaeota archaeon]
MTTSSKQIYLKSFGCPTNLADGEFMVGCLSTVGYEIVENPEKATVIIYNTCAVKTPTENRMINILKKVPRNKKLIVTGCLPLINFERLKAEVEFNGVIGPSSGDRIIEVTRKVGSGEKVVILGNNSKPSLELPRVRMNKVVSIVPINYGCLGACSYCCVQFARGQLRSYSIREIVERVNCDLNSGVREVWLTSQDTACYGKDIGTNLISLLDEICKIDEEFFVRVGMMNPNYALGMLDDLIQVFKDDRIFKFIHLPVQSGDNQVLKLMNRFYSVADFEKIVYQFRKEIPEITLATDVICGFPGEDDEAFNRSLKLVEGIRPDIVNISKFFPRPRSTAGKSRISPQEVKKRSKRVAELCNRISFEKNKKWINLTVRVLIDEEGKRPASWIGRNFAYKPTVIKSNEPLFGRFLNTRIVKAFATYLEAEIA